MLQARRRIIVRFIRSWLVLSLAMALIGGIVPATATTGAQDSFARYVLESLSYLTLYISPMYWLVPELGPEAACWCIATVVLFCAAIWASAALIPAFVWTYFTASRYRRVFLRLVLPTLALSALAVFGFSYPEWQRVRSQRHRLYHWNPCKGNLKQLSLQIGLELGATDKASFFSGVKQALSSPNRGKFHRVLRKALLEFPWAIVCPEPRIVAGRPLAAPHERVQAVKKSASLDELVALIDYNLNASPTLPDEPLLWDKPNNHEYSDIINVMQADGVVTFMDKAEFRKEFPHLTEAQQPCELK